MENCWEQFSIADRSGLDEIQAVFNTFWKTDNDNAEKLASLTKTLFRKSCQHCNISNHERISEFYQILWEKTLDYGLKHFHNSDLDSFISAASF